MESEDEAARSDIEDKLQWYLTVKQPFCLQCLCPLNYLMNKVDDKEDVYVPALHLTIRAPSEQTFICLDCMTDYCWSYCSFCYLHMPQKYGVDMECPRCGRRRPWP
jgi:hypothetical protein